MTVVHRCPGLSSTSLLTYLAALGLARVVGEQVDANVRFGWSGDTFVVRTAVEDLAALLVDHYRPTPVVSPWNGGSGFGVKDKSQRVVLDRLRSSSGDRLASYRATVAEADAVMSRPAVATGMWDKARIVQELRNRLPDEALPWLDATVVLTDETAVFPPIMGTGGNDGRLDYSSNFHQRLVDAIPDLGATRSTSLAWASDLLTGQSTARLQSAAIGQFDPLGAGGPGSSVFGSADARVNPWAFILMVEGVLWFASSPARRLGEVQARAAIPFTVTSSPDGPVPGAAREQARGELWAPVFEVVGLRHLRHIMAEARASWQGGSATRASDMYGAARTFGVDRGISRFQRFGYLQRNGLSYVAVLLDTVEVANTPTVSVARQPMVRAKAFAEAAGAATESRVRAFDSAALRFLRDPRPERLTDMLAAQTRLEMTATRSEGNRRALSIREAGAPASEVLELAAPILDSCAEARVASGVASAQTWGGDGSTLSMRDLLLGIAPRRGSGPPPVARGFTSRRLVDTLADVAVWRGQHPVDDPLTDRGLRLFRRHAYRTHWTDTHAWARGLLRDDLVERYLLAFLAVDWAGSQTLPDGARPEPVTVVPDLAVLQAIASGQVLAPGTPVEAPDGRIGLAPDWLLRLRAGQVDPVCRAATDVLARSRVRVRTSQGWQARTCSHIRPCLTGRLPGVRLLAALCAPTSTGALHAIHALDKGGGRSATSRATPTEGAFA
ncbi:MAG: type I-U CRISPR-associated protein Csx17 [Intrasporangium sp.]|uniref:type I-G CRISPR-associated protein Cas8g1/Csx17 n=1 Tax=Intrasporangium sp. TaxID=1925024 RepID=UPI0026477226|nr:type I-U CRISPR-associated protein Csx17 [Intrasporangium sp.]MDN5797025.1 type I-U CRISPR-associated protein Csx17 [Intrasporangium sp.]